VTLRPGGAVPWGRLGLRIKLKQGTETRWISGVSGGPGESRGIGSPLLYATPRVLTPCTSRHPANHAPLASSKPRQPLGWLVVLRGGGRSAGEHHHARWADPQNHASLETAAAIIIQ